jgi:hypothetical protein
MATINPFYYSMESLQQVLWDKDGLGPLAGGVVSFFSDPSFSVLKDVFQESNYPNNPTFVNIGSVLTLSSIGSFVDGSGNNFIPTLYPWSIPTGQAGAPGVFQPYFITVYSSDGILQFTVDGWPQNSESQNPETEGISKTQNLIINPQFAEISFSPNPTTGNVVFTVSGAMATPIAPGWVINTTGSGIVTVKQLSLSVQTPGDAAYALDILFSAGVSGNLSQTIVNSPRLLEGGFGSGYFEAASPALSIIHLTMLYSPSNGTPVQICTGETLNSDTFLSISGTNSITSLSTDNANGSVTISIIIPVGVEVSITNVQLVGVADETIVPAFIQSSTSIQNAQMFGYWQPALNYKAIPSYLVGWDFPLNPCQALGPNIATQNLGANSSYYIADQTILFQSITNNFSISQNFYGFNFLSTVASTFAVIQYLSGNTAIELLQQRLSVMVQCLKNGGVINGTVNLYWTAGNLPQLPLSVVSTVTAGPVTSPAAGWVLVPKLNGPANFQVTNNQQSFGFNGFDATLMAGITTATFFAIVISFDTTTAGETIALSRVGLVGGDIPTLPSAQTPDEVLRECQYYYEKSYDTATVAPSITAVGAICSYQENTETSSQRAMFASSFNLTYNTIKRTVPNTTIYSTISTTANRVTSVLMGTTNIYSAETILLPSTAPGWSVQNNSTKSVNYVTKSGFGANSAVFFTDNATIGSLGSGYILYQYIADARLGVI